MNDSTLSRLLRPRSVALIGAGTWTDAVAAGAAKLGYPGNVWRVHPSRASTATTHYYRSIAELPGAPDSAFVAVPNTEAPAVAAALAARDAGGFVCLSSGFAELGTDEGRRLAAALRQSAGPLPYLGPNCYGMINYFDRVALWPDQVVGDPPARGVALICQSGTLALTLSFNGRSLPIGYLLSVGNQQRVAAEDLILALSDDERVSAFGLYLEGIQDIARFATAVRAAQSRGKPVALLKSGRSEAAQRTALSHTGALAASDAVFDAWCQAAGVARCDTLAELCETLKLLHLGGLKGRRVLVMGYSGGDMSMVADQAASLDLEFPAFTAKAASALTEVLSSRVQIANPFDMHTYVWFDHAAMRRVFDTVLAEPFDAVALMLDCPPATRASDAAFIPVIDEFIAASAGAKARALLLSSLPETIGEPLRARCFAGGVLPAQGLREALLALDRAAAISGAPADATPSPASPTHLGRPARLVDEAAAKAALAAAGLPVPKGAVVAIDAAAASANAIGYPVALKTAAGLAHKTEKTGVYLGLRDAGQVAAAAQKLAALGDRVLVEQMIDDGVAELLVGINVDRQFGQVLLLGAGGVQTELLKDRVLLLPPWSGPQIEAALRKLRLWPLLAGFRGRPPGDLGALVQAVLAVCRFAESRRDSLLELDVNPLIVRPTGRGVVAVDAMIRETVPSQPGPAARQGASTS